MKFRHMNFRLDYPIFLKNAAGNDNRSGGVIQPFSLYEMSDSKILVGDYLATAPNLVPSEALLLKLVFK